MKAKKINILLVDDNEKFLKSVAERTKLKGFSVVTALSGEDDIEAVFFQKPLDNLTGLSVIINDQYSAARFSLMDITWHLRDVGGESR